MVRMRAPNLKLLGVNKIELEIEGGDQGRFFVSLVVRHKKTNFRWELLVVYGPAHHDLRSFWGNWTRSIMILIYLCCWGVGGWVVNLIRKAEDKNSNCVNFSLMEKFNEFIANNKLLEINRKGSRFTWTNKQKCPIMVNLDRVLVSTDYESNYPLCSVFTLPRVGSDHSPMCRTLGEEEIKRSGRFYFDKNWLSIENFRDVAIQRWGDICDKMPDMIYSLDSWNGGLASLRHF